VLRALCALVSELSAHESRIVHLNLAFKMETEFAMSHHIFKPGIFSRLARIAENLVAFSSFQQRV
jgi:hypothetical protein